MNQILKDRIYRYGTQKQVDFMAELGGMNEEERKVFNLIHQGKSDLFIQEELNIGRKCFSRIEESIRAKLMIAVFECINTKMEQ